VPLFKYAVTAILDWAVVALGTIGSDLEGETRKFLLVN
jgi:hypothetical protein